MKELDLKISFIGQNMPSSPIRKLTAFAQKAEKEGIKIYHLNIGDPDLPFHSVFFKALKDFKNKLIPYADSKGDKDFLEALIQYYQRYC